MNIAIVGSRTWTDEKVIQDFIDSLPEDTVIISGGAKGADTIAERYAREKGRGLVVFRADWDRYGNSAGVIRNKQIVDLADAVVAFWDWKSKGTLNTITRALEMDHILWIKVIKDVNQKTK